MLRTIIGQFRFVLNITMRNSTKSTTLRQEIEISSAKLKHSVINSSYHHIKEISSKTATRERFVMRPIPF